MTKYLGIGHDRFLPRLFPNDHSSIISALDIIQPEVLRVSLNKPNKEPKKKNTLSY
jgi:hypothetical protein